ncbi:MAG: nickel pincer cofactor biosynthesis protein LarC [Myxococcales bacterium]|nr:nickel pincer cofactor biosynthesis protein LarC [Myxococcales bacterium]
MRILYFDCFSGLAGDMTLGALIDLGLDADRLRGALGTLDLPDWHLEVGHATKMGLRGVNVHVVVGGRVEGPAVAAAEHAPHHHHDHPEDHAHHHHHHYADVVRCIESGDLPPPVVARARAAFDAIADAEARVHGCAREQVHFHEVAAVDSVVDIVGAAYGLWALGVDVVEGAPPPMGRGFVRCAHGRMPLPAPATLEILRGLPVATCALERELVTPTGASFLKAWAQRVGPFPEMVVEGTGWGAGDADFPDRPNLLRLVLGRTEPAEAACTQIETNLDDFSPELAGYLMERLFEAGALDAWFVPLQMKKGRPGIQVGALADDGHRAAVEQTLLAESSAIGLRAFPVTRRKLDRRHDTVETPFGPVPVKVATGHGGAANVAPEYEACARLARAAGVPLKIVYQHAVAAWVGRADR